MSYCRSGPDSDVYLYIDFGNVWNLYLSFDVRERFGADPLFAETFTDQAVLRERLCELRNLGAKIPECVFTRVDREIAEGFRGWIK